MEILELYAELLLARAGLLDVRDKNVKDGILSKDAPDETGLEEAAASIIYSAPRLPRDVRELVTVRAMLIERFGKEFAVRVNENQDGIVPVRVVEKLTVEPPKKELVEAYLTEIARTYSVDWPRGRMQRELEALNAEVEDEEEDEEDDGSDGVGGGSKELPILADPSNPQTPAKSKLTKKLDLGTLQNATPPSSLEPGGAKSPVSIAPPGPRSDNVSPRVRLPGGGDLKKKTGDETGTGKKDVAVKRDGGNKDVVGGKIPTVDDLAKRFQALKR